MISILLIAVSLSMDALAASVANALTLRPFKARHAFLLGAYFGFFQFLMPLLGFALGNVISDAAQSFGSYISFALLAFVGIKMALDALNGEGEKPMQSLTYARLFLLAVATSIDALAVGISFAFMEIPVFLSCLIIGGVTFALSACGALLAGRFRGISARRSGVFGGAVLVLIGIKLLVEGTL